MIKSIRSSHLNCLYYKKFYYRELQKKGHKVSIKYAPPNNKNRIMR